MCARVGTFLLTNPVFFWRKTSAQETLSAFQNDILIHPESVIIQRRYWLILGNRIGIIKNKRRHPFVYRIY